MRIPAAVLRDASPGGGMQRVLAAAASFLASAGGGGVDIAAPANKAQARPSRARGARGALLTWRARRGLRCWRTCLLR